MDLLISISLMLMCLVYVVQCLCLVLILFAIFAELLSNGRESLRRQLTPEVKIPTFRRWCGDLKWTLLDLPFRDVGHLFCNGDPARCSMAEPLRRYDRHSLPNLIWWRNEMARRERAIDSTRRCRCNACS